MATLVVRHPDGTENEFAIAGELKIGRQQGSDILITEGGVSRTHARVFEEGGAVFIDDVGSANGTFVDGQRIMAPTALTPQSEVLLGDYVLRLKAPAARGSGARRAARPAAGGEEPMPVGGEGGGARATRAMPSIKKGAARGEPGAALAKRPARPARPSPGGGARPAPAASGPVLRGMTGPWAGQTYPLRGKVIVGRQPPAVILLEDDSVSRRHAELEVTAAGVTVKDLGSANGTLLNGDPLDQTPVPLEPGDQLQFGVVEMTFEAEASAAPMRRGAARGGADEDPAARRKKLIMVAAGLLGVLLMVGMVSSILSPAPVAVQGAGAGAQADPSQKIQELLSECRSYASSELGAPNWDKANEVCTQALDLDPIHAEANTLIRRIKLEKESFEYYSQGERLLQRLKPEEALESFRKIQKESEYFRRARAKAREAAEAVTKRALEDCKLYLRDAQWSAAVSRCDVYMAVWCQSQPRENLQPPLGFTLKLWGRLRRDEWRPKDPLFVKFLIARQKLDANAAPWVCPVAEVLAGDERTVDPRTVVMEAAKKRFPNKLMQAALLDYWSGRGSEALATMQKLRSNYEAAQYHAQADELIKVMSTVDQLFKAGQSFLAAEDPEKAAEPFREALATDKAVMLELAESKPSFYRRNILQDFAEKSYLRGKHWADREDFRRACRVWKLGFSFYAGNPNLNKAAAFCSSRALEAFRAAGSCGDMAVALDYAVKGDGVEEMVVAKQAEMGCK
ncbi:FHA domain-containing protein [Corallococcus macrosporus]|uniref:FHA domain-TPR-repeat-containing protein n=1 Tax=Myxococcus fulvus (strain ATCC BAA-855 / HW-1) TaxID=483219 RepID=F8CMS6_MYXFH|nr:FHA domain-containing protein [Corallococcus macrosporus]AEI66548.1 FHA domain- TPR-repeat-containing protein [Corallococcus macrosporus]